jgi:DNA polymerase ligase (LigD)-like protein
MPRFAILAHDHPAPHWDLFLEAGPVLRSWRLAGPLVVNTPIAAAPAPDHRLVYLDYEGPVSGGRGTVSRVDAGTFQFESDDADRVRVHLAGARFVGRLTITRSTCVFDLG